MEVKQVPLEGSGFRNKMLNDFLAGDDFLKPFYSFASNPDSFAAAIAERKKYPVNRDLLVQELEQQHAGWLEQYPLLAENIRSLKLENTFTVTTGHQLCIAGGPLFFIYKLITVINLASDLRQRYPAYNFIPVYWMATEDHDFAEIAGLKVNGTSLSWKHSSGSATGKLDTSGLDTLLEEILPLIKGMPGTDKLVSAFKKAYSNHTLAEATRDFVLEFLAHEGLIVIDADTASFKKDFSPVIRKELLEQVSFSAVQQTDAELSKRYSLQVHSREINLFYLTKDLRSRIVKSGDIFEVLDTNLRFSEKEILEELELHPERFSPNVILRPVYQEFILPNLAYCGGPAETAYWLQFKKVFEEYDVFYPVLVPRNHAIILEEKPWKHWTKYGLGYNDLFRDKDKVINQVILHYTGSENILGESREVFSRIYNSLEERITKTDPTLTAVVKAQLQKSMNGLDKIERKNLAALRRKNDVIVRQLNQVFELVKPGGVPQERSESFVYMYAQYGESVFNSLKAGIQPFSDTLTVIHP